jgi:hypothetical protein
MPTFWSDETTPLEPKRRSRWLVYLGTNTGSIKPFTAKSCKKPKMTQGKAEHNYLGHTYYFPGNIKWEPVDITLIDPLDPDSSSSRILMDIIEKSGYHPLNDENDVAFITKAAAMYQLGKVRLVQIDRDASPIETWTLHNAWVQDVDPGDLDYSSDELVEVKMTLVYDWATVKYTRPKAGAHTQVVYGKKRLVEDI